MKIFILLLCFTGLSTACFPQNIIQLEYFIDTDAGFGNNTMLNVFPAADGSFPFTVSLSAVTPGYHKLYIRTKDSDGKWGITARRNIEVFATPAKTTIASGEYFIDTDPGFGSGIPVSISSPDSAILQNFTAVTAGLAEGYHKLYGRFKDDAGRWGQTFRRNIEIYNNGTGNAVKAEYFFRADQGFGNCSPVIFTQPATDGLFSLNIQNSDIPAGADTLFIRVQDNSGRWSVTQFKTNITGALPLTLLSFSVVKQNSIANLVWQTANELNTEKFIIERSVDGTRFTSVGETVGHGNSTVNVTYNYADNIATIISSKIYYRLKMTDKDGKFTYSSIRSINNTTALAINVYPNPVVNSLLSVDLTNVKGNVEINIYNSTGAMVYSKQFTAAGGRLQAKIKMDNLSSGSYFIKVGSGSETHLVKFIKIR